MLFIEGETFTRQVNRLLSEAEFYNLQRTLLDDPEAGDVIPGANGARKIRVALRGRGKRGGARAVYFHRVSRDAIFFLAIYAKNEKANLSSAEKLWIRNEVEKMKREVYP